MNLQVIRLLNGEEIIGEVEKGIVNLGYTSVKRPMVILFDANTNNLMIRPWAIFTQQDATYDLNNTTVVFAAEPIDELKNLYQQALGKLITPPKQGLILPK